MPLIKISANIIILSGFVLLARVLYLFAVGELVVHPHPQQHYSGLMQLCLLGLNLPVAFHVMAVGLFIQRKWLSAPWTKTAWYAVVISGACLAAALAIKLIFL